MKKISVIVPVYNVEAYLEECLDSLINQTYKNYEIIIINDGSTDNSLKICQKYAKENKELIKLYDKKNGGLSSARNFGIEKSTGEYLLFVDSDDYIFPNSLEVLGNAINNNKKVDIVEFSFLSGTTHPKTYEKMYNTKIKDPIKRAIVGKPCAQNKFCKKELFIKNKIEFLDGVYYEDLATMPKIIINSKNILFIEEPLYFYRVRENSIMKQVAYNPKMDSIFIVLKQLKEYFKGKYQEEIEFLHIEHLLRGASIRYLDCGNCQEQLEKIILVMKENYPKWYQNKYFKKEPLKRKIINYLLYKKKYKIIKLLRNNG